MSAEIHLFDIPPEIFGEILTPELIGSIGCIVAREVCSRLRKRVRPEHVISANMVSSTATATGPLEVFKWVEQQKYPLDMRAGAIAAEHGHLDILDYTKSRPYDWDWSKCAEVAAANGHLHVIEYLFPEFSGEYVPKNVMVNAVKNSHADILQYLLPLCPQRTGMHILWTYASGNGDIRSLELLYTTRGKINSYYEYYICIVALNRGQTGVLDWYISKDCVLSNNCIINVSSFPPASINWLIDHGYLPDPAQ